MNNGEKRDKRYRFEEEENLNAIKNKDAKKKVSFTSVVKKHEKERDKIINKMRNISRLLACITRRNAKFNDNSKAYHDMIQAMAIVQKRLNAIDAGDEMAIDVVGDACLQDDLDEVATAAKAYVKERFSKPNPKVRESGKIPMVVVCMLSADLGSELGDNYFEAKEVLDNVHKMGIETVIDTVTKAVGGIFGDEKPNDEKVNLAFEDLTELEKTEHKDGKIAKNKVEKKAEKRTVEKLLETAEPVLTRRKK